MPDPTGGWIRGRFRSRNEGARGFGGVCRGSRRLPRHRRAAGPGRVASRRVASLRDEASAGPPRPAPGRSRSAEVGRAAAGGAPIGPRSLGPDPGPAARRPIGRPHRQWSRQCSPPLAMPISTSPDLSGSMQAVAADCTLKSGWGFLPPLCTGLNSGAHFRGRAVAAGPSTSRTPLNRYLPSSAFFYRCLQGRVAVGYVIGDLRSESCAWCPISPISIPEAGRQVRDKSGSIAGL